MAPSQFITVTQAHAEVAEISMHTSHGKITYGNIIACATLISCLTSVF